MKFTNSLHLSTLAVIVLSLATSCKKADKDFLTAFPEKAAFKMTTEDFQKAASPSPDFLPYLHPFAQSTVGDQAVVFGFIPFAEEYIEGVAYTTDTQGKVMDSIVISMVEPPQRQWAEIGSDMITTYTQNGLIEGSGIPGERTEWTDTVQYKVQSSKFIQIE